ncbi:MAG: hypothetical protein ACKVXR_10375 [Planctomycetota bacterium]
MGLKDKNALMVVAVAALVAGAPFATGCKSGKDSSAQTSMMEKHACKGMNACKGMGGCSTGDNGCAGKNSCKGKGGCATVGAHSCKGMNACKGHGRLFERRQRLRRQELLQGPRRLRRAGQALGAFRRAADRSGASSRRSAGVLSPR